MNYQIGGVHKAFEAIEPKTCKAQNTRLLVRIERVLSVQNTWGASQRQCPLICHIWHSYPQYIAANHKNTAIFTPQLAKMRLTPATLSDQIRDECLVPAWDQKGMWCGPLGPKPQPPPRLSAEAPVNRPLTLGWEGGGRANTASQETCPTHHTHTVGVDGKGDMTWQ